jgi:hypothetical protein
MLNNNPKKPEKEVNLAFQASDAIAIASFVCLSTLSFTIGANINNDSLTQMPPVAN